MGEIDPDQPGARVALRERFEIGTRAAAGLENALRLEAHEIQA